MDRLIEYTSGDEIKGYLEIIKVFSDGREEIHFSDRNVITSGMGISLLEAFATTASKNIGLFQIINFQVGTGGTSSLQVSGNGELAAPLSALAQYGDEPSFEIEEATLQASGVRTTDHIFPIIPWPYIKKLTPSRVLYNVYLDENTCNGLVLNEIGLFSNNIYGLTPKVKFLCAYRYFTPLAKQDSFTVVFRWVIEF